MTTSIKVILVIILIIIVLIASFVVGALYSKQIFADELTYIFEESNRSVKIAHLSDLHYPFDCGKLTEIIESINLFNPDYIFLTGDIVDVRASALDFLNLTPFLEKLVTIASVFAVSGNHEVANAQFYIFKETLKDTGIVFLDNEISQIQIRDQNFLIVGLADNCSFESIDLQNLNLLTPLLILSHRPFIYNIPCSVSANAVVFSGHTHGGIIRLFNRGIVSPNGELFPKYTAGLYMSNSQKSILIVSAGLGIGNKKLPRFFNRFHLPLVSLIY
ncbi:MAG: metallophosphoesterase [Christensenellaceae bacterium]|jgi:predicted MPP superfamily phosphohydrolase|nr:metallophosphoesterase [Christensenellaceae bacterium]